MAMSLSEGLILAAQSLDLTPELKKGECVFLCRECGLASAPLESLPVPFKLRGSSAPLQPGNTREESMSTLLFMMESNHSIPFRICSSLRVI